MNDARNSTFHCRLLTPPGVGAIATIRLTGPGACDCIREHVHPCAAKALVVDRAGVAQLARFEDGADVIDDVVVATISVADGSPVIDLTCHGGVRVVERILLACARSGAVMMPMAGPGWEDFPDLPYWSKRAYALLVQATTERGARFLMAQAQLVPAALESWAVRAAAGAADAVRADLVAMADASHGAQYLYHPAKITVIGRPNVGKSSLVNRLAGRDWSIVADRVGTTRDWVTVEAAIDGVPVTLVDTAGLRPTADDLERAAIAVGQEQAAAGDFTVLVFDATDSSSPSDLTEPFGGQHDRMLVIRNKCDLLPVGTQPLDPGLPISARTGQGLDDLRCALVSRLGIPPEGGAEPVAFCDELRDAINGLLAMPQTTREGLADSIRALAAGG